jgi:Kef-type K+ transport system membrane component KefB
VLVGAKDPINQLLVLGLFFVLVIGLLFLATRHQPPKVLTALQRQLHSSSQLPIRLVLFFVVAMSALAIRLGIDLLLGAFAAGMVIRLGITEEQAEGLEPKLDAVGYGFFIPIFFIVSGMGMDAHFFTTLGALRIPIFCGLFFVIRGIPALFIYRHDLDRRSRWGFAVLQSTALPLLVVLTQIGLDTHTMLPVNASAIVAAGMLSVLAFPLIGFPLIADE